MRSRMHIGGLLTLLLARRNLRRTEDHDLEVVYSLGLGVYLDGGDPAGMPEPDLSGALVRTPVSTCVGANVPGLCW